MNSTITRQFAMYSLCTNPKRALNFLTEPLKAKWIIALHKKYPKNLGMDDFSPVSLQQAVCVGSIFQKKAKLNR